MKQQLHKGIIFNLLGLLVLVNVPQQAYGVEEQVPLPPEILGRVMSLRMLSSFGISPFSFALAGLLVDFNLITLFALPSCIILLLMAWLAANPSVRAIK